MNAMKTHIVVSCDFPDRIGYAFYGSRYECERFIRTLACRGRPTHFYGVIANSYRAIDRFKKLHDLR